MGRFSDGYKFYVVVELSYNPRVNYEAGGNAACSAASVNDPSEGS